jgi:uncharacterized protein (TIGR00661 family)
MKILFGVQTEGNGHITQAIGVKQHLNNKGHDVALAFAAKKKKGLASYFKSEFELVEYEGFDFVFGKNGRVIIWKTVLKNLIELPRLILSFKKICGVIDREKPDVIVNFYEPLVGLTSIFYPKIRYISIGHQYAMESSEYPNVKGYFFQKIFLGIINGITSINSTIVALSYYEYSDNSVVVCPPILREESYKLSNAQNDFVLVYLMNEDMLPQLISEATKHSEMKIECFTKLTKPHDIPVNLKVYNLDGKLFQEKMKVCKSVVCSGGFETASEAILQKKPLLMIPMPNHYEQHCNVNDAKIHGFGDWCFTLDLNKIPSIQKGNSIWFDKVSEILDKVL